MQRKIPYLDETVSNVHPSSRPPPPLHLHLQLIIINCPGTLHQKLTEHLQVQLKRPYTFLQLEARKKMRNSEKEAERLHPTDEA